MKTTRSGLGLLLAAAAGALGAWPGERGPSPVALLVWLAIFALPAGFLAGAFGARLLPLGWLVPAAWCGLALLVDARSPRHLPSIAQAAMVWSGLYAAGLALGSLLPSHPWNGSGSLLLAGGILALLPSRAGLDGAPWPPRTASLLLDLSPATLVCESAGLDWMRHPSVYEPVGTDRFERRAWSGSLAGPAALVVGCALCAGAALRGRTKRRALRESALEA